VDWEMPRRYAGVRMSSAAVFATALTILSSAQDYMAESGAPAVAFPKPDRPVADSLARSGTMKRSATMPASPTS
jgi:hypothetical protein